MSIPLTSGIHTPNGFSAERVDINIAPETRERLKALLMRDEMHGIGYTQFIDRACEAAETELEERRQLNERTKTMTQETS